MAMPAAEAEALPTFGEPEPASEPPAMGGMGGGLGAEFSVPEPECEAVIQWRAAHEAKIAEKAAAEEKAVAEKIATAKTDLEQFYAERDAKVKARAAGNREEEQRYIADRDAAILADSWESVCKLVDLKEKADSDTARMRNVLIQLKHVK